MIMLKSEMRMANPEQTIPTRSRVYVLSFFWASLMMTSLKRTWMES